MLNIQVPGSKSEYQKQLHFVKSLDTSDLSDITQMDVDSEFRERLKNQFNPQHSVYAEAKRRVFPFCVIPAQETEVEQIVTAYICGLLTGNEYRARVRRVFRKYPEIIEAMISFKVEHLDVSAYALTKPWRLATAVFVSKPCVGCRHKETCERKKRRRSHVACTRFSPSLTGFLNYYFVGIRDYQMLRKVFKNNPALQRQLRAKYKDAISIANIHKKHVEAAVRIIRKYVDKLLYYGVRIKGKTTGVKFIINYYNEFEYDDVKSMLLTEASIAFCKKYGKIPLPKVINTMKSTVKSRVVNFINKYTTKKRARIVEDDTGVRIYSCREESLSEEGVEDSVVSTYSYDDSKFTFGRIMARQVFQKTRDFLTANYRKEFVKRKVAFCDTVVNNMGEFMQWAAEHNVDLSSGDALLKALQHFVKMPAVTFSNLVRVMSSIFNEQYNTGGLTCQGL